MLLVVNNRSHFIDDLAVRLGELGSDFTVRAASRPIDAGELSRADGIVLSGGPLLLDRKLYLEKIVLDLEVLLEAHVPILGICLGHQLIAETHGAGIVRCPELINQEVSIRVLRQDPLFDGLPEVFKAWESHAEAIGNVPAGFDQLATSDSCRYEAIRHQQRPVYGIQFHPEASGAVGKRILKNFLGLCEG
jgi:GMP synthase (glutamine-hydrolysing)